MLASRFFHLRGDIDKEDVMTSAELQRIADDWATAWSSSDSGDPEDVLALFADDCIFEDVTFGVVAHGKEELRAFANRAFAAVPDFSYGLESSFATTQSAGIEGVMSSTPRSEFPVIPAIDQRRLAV